MDLTKYSRQLELENLQREEGINRYIFNTSKANESGRAAMTGPGIILIRKFADTLAKEIERELKGGSNRSVAIKYLKKIKSSTVERKLVDGTVKEMGFGIDSHTLAVLTFTTVLNKHHGLKENTLCQALAKEISNEFEHRKFKKSMPHYYKAIIENLKQTNNLDHQNTVIMRAKRMADLHDNEEWKVDAVHIGSFLIGCLINSTGLFKRITRQVTSRKRNNYIVLANDTEEFIEKVNTVLSENRPQLRPMIVQPRSWETMFGGGYLGALSNNLHGFVRAHEKSTLFKLDTEFNIPSSIYKAVNAIQATPWTINKPVYEVATQIQELELDIAGMIPPLSRIDDYLPIKPWANDEEFQKLKQDKNSNVIKNWKKQRTEVYNDFNSKVGKAMLIAEQLNTAKSYLNEEEIYFPHNCDYRGRVYPIPTSLTPQGNDLSKGLLMFSEGKPLGTYEAANWLAIHGANKYGIDKVSFDDRLEWIGDNEHLILGSAKDPLSFTHFWASDDCDKPFQFLAFCFEWAGFTENGLEHVSHIPVALDGTCNGLQHLSAMVKDVRGGHAVNLTPSELPNDIYSEVAKVVSELIEEDFNSDDAEARLMAGYWYGKVDRGWCKQNTMTVPYGVTKNGMKEQIHNYYKKKKAKNDAPNIPLEHQSRAFKYLAETNYKAIDKAIPCANAVMNWFKDIAEIVGKEGQPIIWENHMGFTIVQDHKKPNLKHIKTAQGTRQVKLTADIGKTKDTDVYEQKKGLAPNFVHSQDSAHMLATCNELLDQGITSFALIHDDYGTHACHAAQLNKAIRDTFIDQYKDGSMLEQFRTRVQASVETELPECPSIGDLDIETVSDSLYFFS